MLLPPLSAPKIKKSQEESKVDSSDDEFSGEDDEDENDSDDYGPGPENSATTLDLRAMIDRPTNSQ